MKKKRKTGAQASSKLPTVNPHSKCRLRQLKMDRIKDFLLMEQVCCLFFWFFFVFVFSFFFLTFFFKKRNLYKIKSVSNPLKRRQKKSVRKWRIFVALQWVLALSKRFFFSFLLKEKIFLFFLNSRTERIIFSFSLFKKGD